MSLPAVDDGASGPITVPGGFPFGQSAPTTAHVSHSCNKITVIDCFAVAISSVIALLWYILSCTHSIAIMQVSTNGYITFEGSALADPFPVRFPANLHDYTVAPFWDNGDISVAGRISYTESQRLVECVSEFISRQLCVRFTGRWMLLAEWYQVTKPETTTSLVS